MCREKLISWRGCWKVYKNGRQQILPLLAAVLIYKGSDLVSHDAFFASSALTIDYFQESEITFPQVWK